MNVFISHTRENANLADKLYEALRKRGLNPWVDSRDIGWSEDWRHNVLEAIQQADGFVFLLGPDQDRGQSFEMQKVLEQEYDYDPKKAMIPVVVGDVELPGFLVDRKPISLSSFDVDSLAQTVTDRVHNPKEAIDLEKLKRGRQDWNKMLKRQFEDSLKRVETEDKKHLRLLEGLER